MRADSEHYSEIRADGSSPAMFAVGAGRVFREEKRLLVSRVEIRERIHVSAYRVRMRRESKLSISRLDRLHRRIRGEIEEGERFSDHLNQPHRSLNTHR